LVGREGWLWGGGLGCAALGVITLGVLMQIRVARPMCALCSLLNGRRRLWGKGRVGVEEGRARCSALRLADNRPPPAVRAAAAQLPRAQRGDPHAARWVWFRVWVEGI
jgi:hypothetical protein